MDITKKTILHWLNAYNHSREWLGQQFDPPVSRRTVDNWLVSPQAIPRAKRPIIAALMRRDHEQAISTAQDRHVLTLRFTDEQFDQIEQAALRARQPTRQWATDALNNMANMTPDQIVARVQEQQARAWEADHDPRVIANIRQQLDQMARDDNDKQAAN